MSRRTSWLVVSFVQRRIVSRVFGGAGAAMAVALLLAGCGVSAAGTGGAAGTNGTTGTAGTPTPAHDWASLEARPLRLPSASASGKCPVTQLSTITVNLGKGDTSYQVTGQGPVYLAGGASLVIGRGANPGYNKEGTPVSPNPSPQTWLISPAYTGLALVRGQSLTSPQPISFRGGVGGQTWAHELRLQGGVAAAPVWTTWQTQIAVNGPGCYGMQVDTFDASYVIVFRAVLAV